MAQSSRGAPSESHAPSTLRPKEPLSRFGSSRSNNAIKPPSSQSSKQSDQVQAPQQHLLASASSKVLIHKIDDSVPISIINDPHSGWQIGSLAWSHNNMILATCGENDCQIALAKAADGSIIQEMAVCPKGVSITDVSFSSKSTFIAFGCDDASVGIVNIRQKRVETAIRDHDQAYSIRSVSFNCYDTLLASASSDGELIVNALTPGEDSETQIANRIFRDKSMRAPLTMARFSFIKRHVLATAYESGLICIWDLQSIVSQKEGKENIAMGSTQPPPNPLRHKFTAHSNICSGIAFSPVNNLLLCTAGLDSKIFFFDIVEGKQVKKIDVGTPLSTISFCPDGHTIGVGTQQSGQVVIYDLKDSKRVKIELKGHDRTQKISALQFSRLQKPQTGSTQGVSTTVQPTGISRTGSSSSAYNQLNSQRSSANQQQQIPPTQRPPVARPTQQLQPQHISPVPSPLQGTRKRKSNSPDTLRNATQPLSSGMGNKIHSQQQSTRALMDRSPLNNFEREQQLKEQQRREQEQKEKQEEERMEALKAATLAKLRGVPVHEQQQPMEQEKSFNAAAQVKQVQSNLQEMKETIKKELTAENNPIENLTTSNSKENLPEIEQASQQNGLKEVDMMDVQDLENKREYEETKQPFMPEQQQTGLTYEQKQLIENIIDERQTVYINSLKQQFNNMHLELIRNFQAQESDLRGVLMHVATKNKVKKAQLERLQDENKELRKIQF